MNIVLNAYNLPDLFSSTRIHSTLDTSPNFSLLFSGPLHALQRPMPTESFFSLQPNLKPPFTLFSTRHISSGR